MHMKQLLIIGAGGFGREVYNMTPHCKGYGVEWEVKGFLDDTENPLSGFTGYPPVVGPIHGYVPQPDDVFICAIGSVSGKKACVEHLLAQGAEFINLIHHRSSVGRNTKVGIGCILCGGVAISCDCTIGDYVTLQSECILGHDACVGDYSHFHSRVFMGGKSCVAEGVHVGYGAFLHPKKKVGTYATLAAGAYVFRNVQDGRTVVGNPAKYLC